MEERNENSGQRFSFADIAFPKGAPNKEYTSSKEYFRDLEEWLNQAYFWSGVTAAFPYYLLSNQLVPDSNGEDLQQDSFTPFVFPFRNVNQRREVGDNIQNDDYQFDGIECRIPPLWKRIAAETIDFIILFFSKMAVTFIATDIFGIMELEQFDFDAFKDGKLEYKVLLQVTHDILLIEFVHRIIAFFFEAFWLQGGAGGRLGGATPGKSMMGLRVIRCESITFVGGGGGGIGNLLIVRPGTDLGLMSSFWRALLKNIGVTFLIPAFFAFLHFSYNRTGYDIVCKTIVVEEPLLPRRRVRQMDEEEFAPGDDD